MRLSGFDRTDSKGKIWRGCMVFAAGALLSLAGCERDEAGSGATAPASRASGSATPGKPEQEHTTRGRITAIDRANRKITVAHEPIPSLGWSEMTMPFALAPSVQIEGLQPGQDVSFSFVDAGNGVYQIRNIRRE